MTTQLEKVLINPLSDEAFANMVFRELNEWATPEEVAFLHSTVDTLQRWQKELKIITARTHTQIAERKEQLARLEKTYYSHTYADDVAMKWLEFLSKEFSHLRRITTLYTLARERYVRVGQLRVKRIEAKKSAPSPYSDGWKEGIDYFYALVLGGVPPDEAYHICRKEMPR